MKILISLLLGISLYLITTTASADNEGITLIGKEIRNGWFESGDTIWDSDYTAARVVDNFAKTGHYSGCLQGWDIVQDTGKLEQTVAITGSEGNVYRFDFWGYKKSGFRGYDDQLTLECNIWVKEGEDINDNDLSSSFG